MLSDNEPSFPQGSVIFVDCDRKAKSGDFVIAREPVTKQATFKRLMHDAGHWYLRPLNAAYLTVEIPGLESVIGVVVEFAIRRRLV